MLRVSLLAHALQHLAILLLTWRLAISLVITDWTGTSQGPTVRLEVTSCQEQQTMSLVYQPATSHHAVLIQNTSPQSSPRSTLQTALQMTDNCCYSPAAHCIVVVYCMDVLLLSLLITLVSVKDLPAWFVSLLVC